MRNDRFFADHHPTEWAIAMICEADEVREVKADSTWNRFAAYQAAKEKNEKKFKKRGSHA